MGKKKIGSLKLFKNLGLTPIQPTLWTDLCNDSPGRLPRSPLGIFKALMVKRLRQIPSDRELYRRLWNVLHSGAFSYVWMVNNTDPKMQIATCLRARVFRN